MRFKAGIGRRSGSFPAQLVRFAAPTTHQSFFSSSFADGPVRDFIFAYYRLDELYSHSDWRAKVGETEYALLECRACSALFQREVPDETFAQEIYAGWIGRHQTDAQKSLPFTEFAHSIGEAMILTRHLLRHTSKTVPSNIRVLDFGMGRGNFAKAMVACGCQVWGYDFAENRQQNAAEIGVATLAFENIWSTQFDFINTEQVFEHLTNPRHTATLLANSLAQGGLIKISVPFSRWVERKEFSIDWRARRYARYSSMPLQPLEHLTYFRRPSLNFLAAELGLKRSSLSPRDIIDYSTCWTSLPRFVRNFGRAFVHDRYRYYYLFQKTAASVVL